ncbi:sugar transferase [Synechococcus sp. MIT S9509]|uniref:sugar transferase n=1 Tax=Synechococcus sp. MIT S9509 TaxID=1801630 RepID=UPI0009EDBA5A|nr:sugar transferase [Synechococcus sp. MIT S9509]
MASNKRFAVAKRIFDIFFSSIGLIVLSPIMLILGVFIKLDSPGPIFFRQDRVGLNGKLFRIHKFRTMHVLANRQGLRITVGADPRITKIGRWLRKFKLDELPQLIDVWSGDMSFVGPRPEVPEYVSLWPTDVSDLILSVRPGITDFASIKFKDENLILATAKDPHIAYIRDVMPIKLRYYIEYVHTHSIIGDVFVIFSTLRSLLR